VLVIVFGNIRTVVIESGGSGRPRSSGSGDSSRSGDMSESAATTAGKEVEGIGYMRRKWGIGNNKW